MFEDTPAHIEHRELDLNNNELVRYLRISIKHYDMGLTPEGLFLLYREARIQRPSFEFPLAPGAATTILFYLKRDNVVFENAETGQQYQDLNQLLFSLETTPRDLLNRAYTFVDDEARHLYRIEKDLGHRARRSIIKILMQIDGVRSVF